MPFPTDIKTQSLHWKTIKWRFILLTSKEKPSESMVVSTWGVSRPESAENFASFFSLIGKIDRCVGRIGPQTFNSRSTLSSSPRYDSRRNFEEEFRGFCAFLPCFVGLWLDFGGRLRDFQRTCSRQEKMRSNGASQETIGNIAYHRVLAIVSVQWLMESFAAFHIWVVILWLSQCFVEVGGAVFHWPPAQYNFRYWWMRNAILCMGITPKKALWL